MKGKTHDLNHDLTFPAHTINCVCHSIMSMFKLLGIYNFDRHMKIMWATECGIFHCTFALQRNFMRSKFWQLHSLLVVQPIYGVRAEVGDIILSCHRELFAWVGTYWWNFLKLWNLNVLTPNRPLIQLWCPGQNWIWMKFVA